MGVAGPTGPPNSSRICARPRSEHANRVARSPSDPSSSRGLGRGRDAGSVVGGISLVAALVAAIVVVVACVLVVTFRCWDATAWQPATAPVATTARRAPPTRPRARNHRSANPATSRRLRRPALRESSPELGVCLTRMRSCAWQGPRRAATPRTGQNLAMPGDGGDLDPRLRGVPLNATPGIPTPEPRAGRASSRCTRLRGDHAMAAVVIVSAFLRPLVLLAYTVLGNTTAQR